jgi:hypothetical protein
MCHNPASIVRLLYGERAAKREYRAEALSLNVAVRTSSKKMSTGIHATPLSPEYAITANIVSLCSMTRSNVMGGDDGSRPITFGNDHVR